jgi:hypothetical protein
MDVVHAAVASELAAVGHVGLSVAASLRTHYQTLEEHRTSESTALLRHKAFFSFVCGSGRLALADWASKLIHALTTDRTADVVQRIAFDGRLRIDYLQSLIEPGCVYSLPCVRTVVALEDVSSTSVQTADDMLHALAQSVHYFEVVDTNVGRRKLPQTEMTLRRRHMWFHVSFQQYTVCAEPTAAVESLTLRAHGLPHMRDLVDVAPVWRGGLRHLPHGQGTSAGTVSTGDQVYLSRHDWDMT